MASETAKVRRLERTDRLQYLVLELMEHGNAYDHRVLYDLLERWHKNRRPLREIVNEFVTSRSVAGPVKRDLLTAAYLLRLLVAVQSSFNQECHRLGITDQTDAIAKMIKQFEEISGNEFLLNSSR